MLVKRATDRMTSQRLSHLLAMAITPHGLTNGESVTCSVRTSSANPFWRRRRTVANCSSSTSRFVRPQSVDNCRGIPRLPCLVEELAGTAPRRARRLSQDPRLVRSRRVFSNNRFCRQNSLFSPSMIPSRSVLSKHARNQYLAKETLDGRLANPRLPH